MSERRIVRNLLIDADDTLWENNIYYLRCTAQWTALLAPYGVTHDEAVEALNARERQTIRTLGYGPVSYQHSLGRAAADLLATRGLEADEALVLRARDCAEALFAPPMELLPDVEATLLALRLSSCLVLVTKGQEDVQRAKVEQSGLEPLFDHVAIVPEKDAETYRELARALDLDPRRTWMVGNSPRSDINPAVEAGLGAIYVPHADTWTAEHEEIAQPERVDTLARFAELADYFRGEASPGEAHRR